MLSKQTQLNNLDEQMANCSACILRKTCSRVVFGEGSAEAEILFIGEAPGKKEDELGRPFVGAAGKFLDEMLGIINLKREDVYIVNVCKCRPPQNRDPLPEETAACWPWLLEQIKIIRPKLIVTLGRHSMERFLSDKKISQLHGTLVIKTIPEIGKQNFYTLYHPAAALYNGSMRKTLIQDFKKIPKVLEKIKTD
ncbi:MAG TPA: uracil-DNA glycosylase [Candidatus Moranbacteria bacterium]|nr:uracil-DNA glycosylase [Candidatus Moranbacteria bacterium]HAT75109.1 uracil-DNA glycosylase [Candidatus Moranbacteria bacterium]